MAAFFRSISLKARIVLTVLVLLIAAIWGLAVHVSRVMQADLEKELARQLSATTAFAADDLDNDLELRFDALKKIAADITPDMIADPAALQRYLNQRRTVRDVFNSNIVAVDADGRIVATLPVNEAILKRSVAERAYFGEAMRSGKPLIGSLLMGWSNKQPFVPMAVPLRDASGVPRALLVDRVVVSEALPFGQLRTVKIGNTGYLLVVSPRDRLIVSSTEQSRILTRMPERGRVPLLDRRLDEGVEDALYAVNAHGVEVLTVGRKMNTTGWMVIAAVPTAELFAPVTALKTQIYIAALVVSLLVAGILSFALSREFARLESLGATMRRMTRGEQPSTAMPVTRDDEIGRLTDDFNRLIAERERLDQSLRDEIAGHKRAEEMLRESRDRFEGIYQAVGNGIVTTDEQQRIVLFNKAAEQMFDYSAQDIIGKPLSVLLPERFRAVHDAHIRRYGDTGQTPRTMGKYGVISGVRANGEEFPIEAAISQSGTTPNKLFTVILRDITERRKAEQLREQLTRQLELLSERLATVQEDERRSIVHELHEELGQELTTLQIYLQMLGGAAEPQPHRQEALAITAQAIERVRRLVDDLNPPDLEDFGLHAALRTHCQRQAEAGKWTVHIDAPRPEKRAPRTVERACFRVLQDALSNVMRHAGATEVWVSLDQDDEAVELAVRDNGVGFSDPKADGTRRQGEDIGLFAMRMRAKQAGGSLTITSVPGRGTEVRAIFQLSGRAAAE